MSEMARDDLIAMLEAQLAREKREQANAGMDEGQRLHDQFNAPYRSGQYANMVFPPYVFKPFPRMVYSPDYPQAVTELARVKTMHYADVAVQMALIAQGEKAVANATKLVHTETEYLDAINGTWSETPDGCAAAKEARDSGVARQAAERAFDDRRLGTAARAELDAIDATHEGHLVEVPTAPKRGRPTNAEREARQAGA